jgi:hypothetical protein
LHVERKIWKGHNRNEICCVFCVCDWWQMETLK